MDHTGMKGVAGSCSCCGVIGLLPYLQIVP
jgi:hypothetical protein